MVQSAVIQDGGNPLRSMCLSPLQLAMGLGVVIWYSKCGLTIDFYKGSMTTQILI